MRFCPADVAINMVDKWTGDWNQFLESKKSEFDMDRKGCDSCLEERQSC
jgi:hypothetical protein